MLVVLFPSDVIEEFFFSEYSLWASKNGNAIKKRSCDGETCTHFLSETIGKTDYAAGDISDCLCRNEEIAAKMDSKYLCKSYTAMKAFILDPKSGKIISPMCYQFQTGSDNSSDNIYTELEKIWHMTGGRLIKVPFILSVRMVEKITGSDAQKRKFPIWSLQAWGTTEQILELAGRKQLPTTDETAVVVMLDDSKAIEAPKQPNAEFAKDFASGDKPKSDKTRAEKIKLIRGWLGDIGRWGFEEDKNGTILRYKIEKQETINTNATASLKEITAFPGKDDKEAFTGFDSIKSIENIKETWFNSVYGNIKTAHEKWQETFNNSQE